MPPLTSMAAFEKVPWKPYVRDLRCSRPFQDPYSRLRSDFLVETQPTCWQLAVNRVKFSGCHPLTRLAALAGGENRAGFGGRCGRRGTLGRSRSEARRHFFCGPRCVGWFFGPDLGLKRPFLPKPA